MQTRRTPISCGCNVLFNLHGVSDVRGLRSILQPKYKSWGERRGFDGNDEASRLLRAEGSYDNKIYAGETVIFSDADYREYGRDLRRLIKKHGLGKVVSIKTKNPNTETRITTYLWVYNGKLPKAESVAK